MAGGSTAATVPTLAELAAKLSKLREHLDQVVADLAAPRGNGIVHEQPRGAGLGGFRNSAAAQGRLRCHACGRMGSKDEVGWTLRLCGDDELHAFCPDCDEYFSGNGA